MGYALIQLAMFAAKAIIIVILILLVLIAFFALIAKSKQKLQKGKLVIKNLNQKYADNTELLLTETLSKKAFKKFLKDKKVTEKAKEKAQDKPKNIYVLNFEGDIKAS